jgi:hypothetical protein
LLEKYLLVEKKNYTYSLKEGITITNVNNVNKAEFEKGTFTFLTQEHQTKFPKKYENFYFRENYY